VNTRCFGLLDNRLALAVAESVDACWRWETLGFSLVFGALGAAACGPASIT
jgi:hypothetical protein